MKSEQTKSTDPTNVLKDPALLRQNVSLSIQEIQELFQPSGEAKDGVPLLSKECVHKSQEDVDEALQKWPDALQCTHGGIIYNSDPQAEEKESLGNRMVDLYVRQETAGICGRAELPPDSPRRIPFTLSSELRSFIDRGRSSFEGQPNRASSEKRRSETEVRTASKNEVDGLLGKSVDVIRKLAKKGSAPVRCSPRKKTSVHYGPEQRRAIPSKSKNVKVQNKSTQELPDILRKKLRAAVATALEGQGVQLDDPFFRPCGKRLFAICQAFVQDLSVQKGSMSQRMQKIAEAHVKQVVEYERQRESGE
ncbi:uncharacterized protein LOC129216188 [Uloborus diversus]|uniref:uncharacterized protein LOC129216188 n=1 Tax=Uloborus diversus TaxID=327109 RepID=UPI00240A0D5D|nr:uncharacterized protein LOC129216188 [Uloborus diversus]